MSDSQQQYQGKVHFPSTTSAANLSGYRVPRTNETLARFDFDKFERDLVFEAYGQGVVLKAMALYFGTTTNVHRDAAKEKHTEREVYAAVKPGLIATMESIRTRGGIATENAILEGYDILEQMQEKYSHGRTPALRTRNDNDMVRLGLLEDLVKKHVVGETI